MTAIKAGASSSLEIDEILMFQEFQISVSPLGNDEYWVRTENVVSGVILAEQRVYLPVEDWLAQARQLMNDPLLEIFEEKGNDLSFTDTQETNLDSFNFISLGQQLFNFLFQGNLQSSFQMAQAVAHHERAILRLRLVFKDARISRLPWEVMHAGDRALATGIDMTFSRYHLHPQSRTHSQKSPYNRFPTPKILMVIAGPSDQETLALKQEAIHLQEELQQTSQNEAPKIELTLLEQPGREQLTQALEQGNYSIFHYAGHSNLGDAGGDVYLVNSQTGLTETLSGEDLAGLLANNGIQLVVLNSCRGAGTVLEAPNLSHQNRSLVQALAKRNIPAILAMAEQIPDDVALTLTRLFYRNLHSGCPIDLSLSRARQGLISAYGSNQLYWALPVLYLHPDFDGTLFPWGEQDEDDVVNFPMTPEQEELLEFTHYSSEESEMGENEATADLVKGIFEELDREQRENTATFALESGGLAVETETWDGDIAPSRYASTSLPKRFPWQKRFSAIPTFPLIGIGSAVAIAILVILMSSNRSPQVPTLREAVEMQEGILEDERIWKNLESSTLGVVASQQLSQGNLEKGLPAVEELLNRGALSYVEEALEEVPQELQDTAKVNFLWGRLAWEVYVQNSTQEYPRYNVDDARRYWQMAVDAEPKLEYLNALAFAYYAEGNYDQANQVWYDAVDLIESQGIELTQKEALNTYAGLALGLKKWANELSGRQAEILQNNARKLYNTVMMEAPLDFDADGLADEWLWSESAIADWESFTVNSNQ